MVKDLFCCTDYKVDDRGFIISKRGKPLKPSTNYRGYQIVNLMMNGKRVGMGVHTAVARAFVDGYAIGLQVNHKDGDKKNNNANNLEWVTPLENVKHSREVLGFDNCEEHNPQAKAVTAFDYKTGKCMYHFNSVMSAARYFSPNDENKARHIQSIISGIACGYGTKKTYHGCIWRYL